MRLAPHASRHRLAPDAPKQSGFALKTEEILAALAPSGAPLPCKSRRRSTAAGAPLPAAKDTLRNASKLESKADLMGEARRWLQILEREGRDSRSTDSVGGVWLIKIPCMDRGQGVQVHGD